MSINNIISDLQQVGATDLSFVRQLRSGLNEILNGIEDACHRRDDSLHELEHELRAGGYVSKADLQAEVEALRAEKAVLVGHIKALQRDFETYQTRFPSTRLSNKRRNILKCTIDAIIRDTTAPIGTLRQRAGQMIDEWNAYLDTHTSASAEDNIQIDKERRNVMQRSLKTLANSVKNSGDHAAALDLEEVSMIWEDIVWFGREVAGRKWSKHYSIAKEISESLNALTASIEDLRSASEVLNLRNERTNEDPDI